MKIISVLLVSFLLSGCAPLSSQQQQIILNRCPVLVNYTPEQQKIAAQELRSLYSQSQLAIMITDYSKLREACRLVNKRVQKKFKQIQIKKGKNI